MKKIMSVLLLIVLSFTLISCSRPEFNFEDDDSSLNFNGTAFTLYSDSAWFSRTRGGNASADRFLDRIEEIEKKYNLIFNNNIGNTESKILAMTLTGGGGADMVQCMNDSIFSFYKLGILTPFEEIGVKDHEDEKFGIPSFLFEGTFDGTQYGIINYLGDSVPNVSGTIGINMNLLEELGMDDPHEYVESGTWDWQNFRAVLRQGTVDDGEIKHTGMLIDWLEGGVRACFPAVIANNGYFVKEINGVYKSGLTNANTIEAIEYMTGLIEEGLVEVNGGIAWDIFSEGRTWPLFLEDGPHTSPDIDYALVRFPYGPNGSPDIVAGFSFYRTYFAFTILSVFTNDETGIIIDDLFEPLDKDLYPNGWKDYAIDNIFYSDEDYETYLTALDTMQCYPLAQLYGTNPWNHKGEVEDALLNIVRGLGSVQSEIDSVKNLFEEIINEKLNK